jgi:guanine deaminase
MSVPSPVRAALTAIRGAFVDFVADPFVSEPADSVRYITDGLLVLEAGRIKAFGPYAELQTEYAFLDPITYPPGCLILPGLIDAHSHYPQSEMIAAYGAQLLDWLETYTFPVESKFQDADYARSIAQFFLDELLRQGTTTAVILTTIFPESVAVLFEEAAQRNMRIIAGQVLMTRNAPDFLLNPAETAYAQTREQIQTWHGQGRSLYAITPRFAITSTPQELQLAGQLKAEFPDVYVHTHLSENQAEIEFTLDLFPDCQDYLQVYERFGLVGDRSLFAHGVHLSDSEFARLGAAGAAIAFCPTANLFLGSGLFNLAKAQFHQVPVALGTDVGGGTSFSLLNTLAEAYKVAQLQGKNLSAFQAFYLVTLGAAQALNLATQLGNFSVGKEADLVVLDVQATPVLALRNPVPLVTTPDELASQLFALAILGDDRAVRATYVAGHLRHTRS